MIRITLALLAVFVVTVESSAAAEFIVRPVEDAWINQVQPDSRYGEGTYLSLKDRGGQGDILLSFDLSNCRIPGEILSSASLFLYQYQATYSPGDFVCVRPIAGDWNEADVTWNAKPAYADKYCSALDLSGEINCWREWKGLESMISSWGDGKNYGLALENSADGVSEELFARFYSSEGPGDYAPFLKVTTYRPTAAPEPASAVLFIAGSSAFALRRRLKKARVKK